MPDATITSTASTFGTITGTFAADQSTVTGTVTGIIAGTLTGSVGVPGPQGPAGSPGSQGPQGVPGAPGQGVAAGGSTGQVLQKLSATSYDTGWLTLGTMAAQTASDYSTTAVANGLYYPLTGNPSAFITASALTPYLEKAGGIITGNIVSNNGSTFSSYDNVYKTVSFNANNLQLNNSGPGGSTLTVESDGITFATGKQTLPFPGAATLFTSPVLTGDPTAPTPATSDNDTSIATTAFVKAQGYLTSAPVTSVAGRTGAITLSNTDISGLGSLAVVNDAPSDGSQYARKNGAWDVVSAGASYITSVSSPLAVATGNLTVDLSAYLTSATAASTYQTLAGMSSYLTTATAASTYYLQTNPSGFQTAGDVTTALSPYLLSATAASTYAVIAAGQPVAGTTGQVLTKNSGTNYDSSWTTIIPGDRYLTSSTTSNTVSNGNKTFTIGTGLSYTPTQNITISYDASNHMHGEVLTYNSGTGVLTVDIKNHIGSGTYTAWVVNVGGVTPATSVAWGAITGTLSSQTDLQSALDLKLAVTTAAATYLPLSGGSMPAGSAIIILDGGIYIYETVLQNSGLLIRDSASTPLARFQADEVLIPSVGITFSDLTVQTSAGISAATVASTYQTIAGMSSYATLASPALTGNVTITSNSASPALVITQDGAGDIIQFKDVTSDTTYSFIDANGKVSTIASTTANAGFNIAHGAAPTSPVNGDIWTTTTGLFARINNGTRQFATLSDGQSFSGNNTFTGPTLTFGNSTAASTVNIGTGATLTATTKAVNIGTAGVAGSTTNITVGPVLGASTTSIGNTTAASTLNLAAGATLTATTKAVNIGTAGVAGSTTNIAIGSTTGTSTTTLQGITNGITQTAGDSSLKLATTAFVTTADNLKAPLASPTFTGTVTIPAGASISGFAPLASPTFSGSPSLPTGTIGVTQSPGNNTTALATTAFVTAAVGAGGAVTSVAGRTGAVVLSNTDISGLGTMATATAADYSTTTVANGLYYPLSGNPSSFLVAADIAGKADIASPSLTGTPLSTTAAVDTNTTQIATTAFVVGQAASATPLVNGTAAVGTSLRYARADHVHGTDTTRAPLASPTFTGTVTIPAGASISGFAPLASPTFTGTPTLPTGTIATTQTAGNNTTAVATTAFVTAAIPTNNVKAWISFNGSGTPAIRGSMNVTSITDNGAGDYTINFTTAMSDANYATVVTAMRVSGNTGAMGFIRETTTPTTALVRIGTTNQGGTAVDPLYVTCAILR